MNLLRTENLLKISNIISEHLKRPLTDSENMAIVTNLRKEDLSKYKQHPEDEILSIFAERMKKFLTDKPEDLRQQMADWQIKEMSTAYKTTGNADFINQELGTNKFNSQIDSDFTTLVSKEIKFDTLFDTTDLHYLQRILAPKAQYRHIHILLDTNKAAPELSSGTKYGWNFANNALLQGGTVNATGSAKDLVGMRIHPMTTELVRNPSQLLEAGNTPYTHTGAPADLYRNDFANLNHNFTILIEEFAAQSFVGRNGRKFHFVLFPFLMNPETEDPVGSWTPIEPYYEFVTSGKGDGWFWFKEPITSFSTLTISMANPFIEFSLSSQTRTLIPLELIYLADEDGE